jgi:sugar O-acyltransferase (sialic acid O-acetyltransferase NeuD family)
MSKKLVVMGGEGNGGVIVSCVEDNIRRFGDEQYRIFGWLNDLKSPGEEINGYPVLGPLAHARELLEDPDVMFMWAVHVIGRGPMRERLFASLGLPTDRLATIVHGSAFVASNTVLEPGVFIMANTYVGPATRIGQCTLVMANCVIGHNDDIGPFNHISAGAIVSSYVKTGKFVDICLGTKVIEKLTLGDYCVAGAGALVLKDIPAREIHIGAPARKSRVIEEA